MSSTINGTGLFTHSYARALTQMRSQFDSLSLQLATGQKSQTYGGLGSDRGMALHLKGKLAALGTYASNIQQVGLRTNMMSASLTTMTDIAQDTRGDMTPTNWLLAGSKTIAQNSTLSRLDTMIESLNVNVAGVYLFGGREVSTPPVAKMDEILNGTLGRDGLKTVMAERTAADLGTDGRGRLTFNVDAVGTGLGAAAENDLTNAGAGGAGFVTDGNTLDITVGGTTATFTIDDGGINTLDDLVNAINADASINGDVTASNVNGQLRIVADAGDVTFTTGGPAAAELGIASPVYDPDTTIRLAEDAAPSPFGFKLVGAETNIAGATATGPAGTPPALEFTLTAQPASGDSVRFALELPDGSFEEIELTATTTSPAGPGQFTIGTTLDETVDNLRSSMDTAVQTEAKTSLAAASAITGSRNFFGEPPLRVDGPPGTATALVDGTATTFDWYRGESGTDSARQTQNARIDATLNASYGARANEEGVRELMESLGAFAVMELNVSDEEIGKAQYTALTDRLRPALSSDTGLSTLESLVVEITNVSVSLNEAKERHTQSEAVLETMLANIEGVSKEEVAASLLALQTNLQASYQVTAMASQLTLVNFL